ncbi:hypothetical protein [Staphylothermus hellenicus]|nr:hypothetical protein [Staphylothermus hellenicus]
MGQVKDEALAVYLLLIHKYQVLTMNKNNNIVESVLRFSIT